MRRRRWRTSPGSAYRERGDGFRARPAAAGEPARRRRVALPNRAARVLSGYTIIGRADRRRRDLARLHLRLQLLLDHRDARPQLPHAFRSTRVIADIADARGARRARDLHRRRQHHARTSPRFEALCRAIVEAGLNDIDYIVQAHDLVDRRARRHAGAADAARPGSATCSSASRTSSTRTWRSCSAERQERAARGRAADGQRDDCAADRRAAPARHARRRRPDRRQPRRHAGVDRGQPRVRAAATSTGRTSSIRRRIPARR